MKNKQKITREKRPDRIEVTWKNFRVLLMEDGTVEINPNTESIYTPTTFFPKSEIPNLIKALGEITK